jgi:glycosyltransferase involved in cell wall biosynthesis
MNKNVLMLCYYYPPLTDVGSKRSVAFSKYLRKHGWNPHVLSVKNPDRGWCSVGNDAPPEGVHTEYSYSIVNLSKAVGKANGALQRLSRIFKRELTRNYVYEVLCIPDRFWGWIPLTLAKALRLIRRNDIGVIYASCSPWSSAVIGALLKKMTGRPLVLDYRDPYGLEETSSILKASKFRRIVLRSIDAKVLRHADIFIVNNEDTKKAYVRQYPWVENKIFAIHNGFDPDYLVRKVKRKYQKFTVVYTGEFYFYASKSRIFFEALALLKSRGKIHKDNFQFLFHGDGDGEIARIAADCKIEDLVSAHGRVPYRQALEALSSSHLQLLRIVKPMISTKLFEGIPLNVPFLATIPSGEVEEIIRTYSPSSYVVTEESAGKVAEAILDAMAKYENNEIQDNHVGAFLERFSRENLTLRLIDIMEKNLDHEGQTVEDH